MTLHISEAEVRAVLTMPAAVQAVEEISRKQATGEVVVHPRRRFELPGGGFFHYMAAADYSTGYVATRYLARKDARVAAIIGTGGQAKTQLEAVATVRKLASARAYGRDAAKREKFCHEMSGRLGIPVRSCSSASEAVRDADIVSTATTSSQPVVRGADLAPGAHINAIGANHAHKRELDDEAVASADIIVVDSVEQSRQEAGDLIIAFHGDEICWTGVKKLSEIVAGKTSGRTSDTEVTLFKSNGIASWDLAVAMKVYAMAREKKLGRELPLWSDGAKG